MTRSSTLLRWYANCLNLTTAAGLGLAVAARLRPQVGPRGVILVPGYRWGLPDASAFTVGNVVFTRDPVERLRRVSPRLLLHEERHCTQYALCLGLPFLALYSAATGWSLLRTGDRARGNPFERWAGLEDGGYSAR